MAKSAEETKQAGSQLAKETSDASAPRCTAGNFFLKKHPRCQGLSRNPWTSFIKETRNAATSTAVEVGRTIEECQTPAPQETEDVTDKTHVCSTSGRRRLTQQPIIQRLVVQLLFSCCAVYTACSPHAVFGHTLKLEYS